MKIANKRGLLALSPLIVFITLYLGTSIIAGDFYKVPLSVAFIISGMCAVAVSKESTLTERIITFSKGASTDNIMLMIWIFILAGIFATTAQSIGCIDATVNLMLTVLPDNMVLAGMFIASCFISLSIGTSVGTIIALTPIAAGLAVTMEANIALIAATVVGGAFFGDNMSFISDTTIAATSSQGCKMSDKFRVNIRIVMPVAIAVLATYIAIGMEMKKPDNIKEIEYIKILPYVAVLATALSGMNVIMVLTIGIILTAIIGITTGSCDFWECLESMGQGVQSMTDLIIITMLAGGLFETVRRNGGIEYLTNRITKNIHGKRGAEFVIGFMTALVNICTANNTVAIITVGGIAKQISNSYGIDSRKAASILDTFSCCMQGVLPYGVQILMAASLTKISPIDILPYLYYPIVLGAFTLLCIYFRYPKSYYR